MLAQLSGLSNVAMSKLFCQSFDCRWSLEAQKADKKGTWRYP
jgi:hypothetical protein